MSVIAVIGFSLLATWLIAKFVDAIIGLRVNADQETEGLDISIHEERAYDLEIHLDELDPCGGELVDSVRTQRNGSPNHDGELHESVEAEIHLVDQARGFRRFVKWPG